jgi:hypothetical protein
MVPLLEPTTIDLTSPFLRLALRNDVIAAVTAYLGIVPVLAHLQVYYSEAGVEEARSSQLFHCDADATAQVKIFVLCSEVTLANGPLTLLEAETSRGIRPSFMLPRDHRAGSPFRHLSRPELPHAQQLVLGAV